MNLLVKTFLPCLGKPDEALEIMITMAERNEKPPIEGTLKPVQHIDTTWSDIFRQPYTR